MKSAGTTLALPFLILLLMKVTEIESRSILTNKPAGKSEWLATR